jgi:Na+:H+ antiporter, NhaA family
MGRQQEDDPRLSRLPREPIDRVTGPLARFLRIETAGGAVLLLSTAVALVLSNSPWANSFLTAWEAPVGLQLGPLALVHPAREWINDGLMTMFFFVVALELKRELVLGELRNPRVAALSVAAALGGMLMPATLYLLRCSWAGPGSMAGAR